MNGIAKNLVPTDEMLRCEHIIGLVDGGPDGYSIARPCDSDRMEVVGGLGFTYCPICGARLED